MHQFSLTVVLAGVLLSCAPAVQKPSLAVNESRRESATDLIRNTLHQLAGQLADLPSREPRPRIAVVDFADIQNKVPAVSPLISEMLITELFRTGKFIIVERTLLSKVLEQHALNMSGLVDEGTARRVGKLLGVDYIVSGTLLSIGDVMNVNARMIAIESGSIEAIGSVELNMSELAALKPAMQEHSQASRTTYDALGQPPSGGAFTPWQAGDAFGRDMGQFWKDGYYPALVEGRYYEGRNEFRAVLQPFPKRTWWFYWWYGQLRSSYEEHRKNMVADGFNEISLNIFVDGEGMRRYQTCWIKYGP